MVNSVMLIKRGVDVMFWKFLLVVALIRASLFLVKNPELRGNLVLGLCGASFLATCFLHWPSDFPLFWPILVVVALLIDGIVGTIMGEEEKLADWKNKSSDPNWRANNPDKMEAIDKQRRINEAQAEQKKKQEEFNKKRADLLAKGVVSCPNCGSTAITSIPAAPDPFAVGYSAARELAGGCTVKNVCQACGCRFYPGV